MFRETSHLFLDLPAFAEQLTEWIERQGHWRPNVPELLARAAQRAEAEADHPRPRLGRADPGAARVRGARRQADLRLVRRASSATCRRPSSGPRTAGRPRPGATGGRTPTCATCYFMGKDNIVFHTVIWPSILLGYGSGGELGAGKGPLTLPYDVVASEFLTMEGKQFSVSRGVVDRRRRLPEPLRPRPASLLPDRSWTGDPGHRLHVVGVRAPEQRRARRQLGQPRQPDAELGAQELRRGSRAGRADGRRPRAPRCDRGGLRDRGRSDRVRALPGCARRGDEAGDARQPLHGSPGAMGADRDAIANAPRRCSTLRCARSTA